MRHFKYLAALLLGGRFLTAALAADLGQDRIDFAASNAPSFFLNANQRTESIRTFLSLVQIKGSSGKEESVRKAVKESLVDIGAVEIPLTSTGSDSPLNLAMELPATGSLTNAPGILLNAHLDTIAQCTPEHIRFDPESEDFYHEFQADPERTSSFGGDDRSGVAAIVGAMRFLQRSHWNHGVPHRRIVLLFTAQEEVGCRGARHVARAQPEFFDSLDISISMDGPLDFRPNPPTNRVIAVVAEADLNAAPYRQVMRLLSEFSNRTKIAFEHTEYGLGRGDFAYFPPNAHAGLHLRSPVRGYHGRERVNVRDQINHVDLLCYLILGWDQALPK